MSPVRTGRKAASSKNPAVIFAWGPGKIQTKASTPRPADGGHDRAFYKRALRGGGGGARSDGKRSEVRIQRSGKAPKGRQGGRGRGGGAKRSLKHTGARPVDGARRGRRWGKGFRVRGSGKEVRMQRSEVRENRTAMNSLCARRAQLQNSRCGARVGWKSLGVMGKIGKMVEMGKMGGDLGFWDEVRGVGILGGRG